MGRRNPAFVLMVALVAAALLGCAQAERGAVVVGGGVNGANGANAWKGANLALGPHPGLSTAAQHWAGRAPWPATDWGYVFEDVTIYRRDAYDNQLFFDRRNSSYFINDSTRTGVLIR